jgi:hypothetical protein
MPFLFNYGVVCEGLHLNELGLLFNIPNYKKLKICKFLLHFLHIFSSFFTFKNILP